MKYPKALERLIQEFSGLPSIGPRSAKRLSFYLLSQDQEILDKLGQAIIKLKEEVFVCPICFCLKEENKCLYCDDFSRDSNVICVVEERENVLNIENSSAFRGLYHVLEGVLSPLEGISPDKLKITELTDRIKKNKPSELIIATNPTIEGETTAHYLCQLLKEESVQITRLACGLPSGGDIKYSDTATINKAFEGRQNLQANS